MNILTAFKALSWVKGFGTISGLGFLGPIPAIVSGLFKLLWGAISYVLKGFADILSSPMRAVTCTVIAMVTLAIGAHVGRGWDRHLVLVAYGQTAQAKADIASLETQLKAAKDADDGKAKAAIEARDAAKSLGSKPASTKRVRPGATGSSEKDSHSLKIGVLGF